MWPVPSGRVHLGKRDSKPVITHGLRQGLPRSRECCAFISAGGLGLSGSFAVGGLRESKIRNRDEPGGSVRGCALEPAWEVWYLRSRALGMAETVYLQARKRVRECTPLLGEREVQCDRGGDRVQESPEARANRRRACSAAWADGGLVRAVWGALAQLFAVRQSIAVARAVQWDAGEGAGQVGR